jgi:tRNA-2-methylthio-N6-dimethylallyladenosine synthase
VNEVDGLRRIRFTSPHPHDFTPDVVEAMAESEKVCEHIHFPLQSGSDRVLRAMRRSYRSARYLDWLRRIREAIPEIAVTTDIIVGFPGETEDDFRETLRVVEEARFDAAYTFQYSPRAGTEAAQYEDQLPKDVVQERFERLVELQEGISLERNLRHEGEVAEVLVEGRGRKGGLQGRTRTNTVVNFEAQAAPGDFLDVRIDRAHPHHLTGEPVRVPVATP